MTLLVKRELVAIVADGVDWPRDFAERFVTAVFDELAAALLRGEDATLPGVGVFSVRNRSARTPAVTFGWRENVHQNASRYVVLSQSARLLVSPFARPQDVEPEALKRWLRMATLHGKHHKEVHYHGDAPVYPPPEG